MSKRHLKPGDTIGIIALSSPCAADALKSGVSALQQFGFKTKIALNPSKNYGGKRFLFSSDSAINRAKALEGLFRDKKVKAIISARGAYGAMEVLQEFDFDVAKKNPKPLIGFSDTTVFLVALTQIAGIVTLHGPSVSGAFASMHLDKRHAESARSTIDLLSGVITNPFYGRSFKPINKASKGKGKLLGGSLTLLSALLGSRFEPQTKGKILFIEECGERPYRVLRMLTSLKLAGKLEQVKGVILGSFKDCTHESGPTVEEIFKDFFKDAKYPVLSSVPFGHELLNLPIPLGVEAQIKDRSIIISSPFA